MKRFGIIAVFVVIGGIVSIFTVSSKDVKRFNDSMVDAISSLDSTYTTLDKQLDAYTDGKEVDLAMFSRNIESATKGINRRIDSMSQMKVPDDEYCKAFHSSALSYSQNNLKIISIYNDKILPYIKEHNPGSKKDSEVVYSYFTDLAVEDEKLLNDVQEKQKNMARKFKLKLQ